MVSFNNQPLSLGSGDQGSNFTVYKNRDVAVFAQLPANGFNWRGQIKPGNLPSHLVGWFNNSPTIATESQLNSLGATGIARSVPTSPAYSLSTAVGELMADGLPMVSGASLFKERVRIAREAGSEYLNVQFGWLPLLNDIQQFAKTVKTSDEIIDQYRKDSGNKIRRRYIFPPSYQQELYSGTGFQTYPLMAAGSGNFKGVLETKTWFSGAFRYYIPTSDTQLGKFKQWASLSNRLLGWKVTPETVWNIAPWSWAVDWFTNYGDVITNITALGTDGLVMQYGYLMNHKRHEMNWDMTFDDQSQFPPRYTKASRSKSIEIKQRIHAHPYGFGVQSASLSARQIAIMAALGLSKT
jgi:hypothetical protein